MLMEECERASDVDLCGRSTVPQCRLYDHCDIFDVSSIQNDRDVPSGFVTDKMEESFFQGSFRLLCIDCIQFLLPFCLTPARNVIHSIYVILDC